MNSAPWAISSKTLLSAWRSSRLWSTYASWTVSPISMVPGVGRLLADDHPEQRRLAGPVGTDDPDDPGLRQRERQVLDQQPVAVALAQALDLDDRVAEARPGRDRDLELAVGGGAGVRLGQQLLVGTESGLALGLAGARGQAHPLELAGEGALAGVGGALLPGEPSKLLFEPRASSCPRTGCRGRGRARGSTARRGRGSSDRG